MKKHFARLRRFTAWSSFGGPLLFFIAFLLAAWSLTMWAFIAVGLGILLLCAFPCETTTVGCPVDLDGKIKAGLIAGGTLLLLFWTDSIPEFEPFIDHLFSSGAIQDWRLIVAVFLWICHWGYTNYLKASSLEDHEIVAIFEASSQSKKYKPNKS